MPIDRYTDWKWKERGNRISSKILYNDKQYLHAENNHSPLIYNQDSCIYNMTTGTPAGRCPRAVPMRCSVSRASHSALDSGDSIRWSTLGAGRDRGHLSESVWRNPWSWNSALDISIPELGGCHANRSIRFVWLACSHVSQYIPIVSESQGSIRPPNAVMHVSFESSLNWIKFLN